MNSKSAPAQAGGNAATSDLPALQGIRVRQPTPEDLPAILELHKRAFGPGRFTLSAYRVREGTAPISHFCRMAERDGQLIAAVRMTPIDIGGKTGALLLGPLAVEPPFVNTGFGRTLIHASLSEARQQGLDLVVLVGNASYYGRFGFHPVPPGQIKFPGPVDPARILAHELTPSALTGFRGPITAAQPHASE